MPQKEKLTVTITAANKKTIQTIANRSYEGNFSMALRAILNEYAEKHTK